MKECGGGVVDERSKRCHDSSKFGVGHRGHRSRVSFFGIITLHIHLGVLRALLLRDSTAAEVEGVFLTTVFMVLLSPVALTLSLPPQIARGCNARNATGENHWRDLSTIDRRRRSSSTISIVWPLRQTKQNLTTTLLQCRRGGAEKRRRRKRGLNFGRTLPVRRKIKAEKPFLRSAKLSLPNWHTS